MLCGRKKSEEILLPIPSCLPNCLVLLQWSYHVTLVATAKIWKKLMASWWSNEPPSILQYLAGTCSQPTTAQFTPWKLHILTIAILAPVSCVPHTIVSTLMTSMLPKGSVWLSMRSFHQQFLMLSAHFFSSQSPWTTWDAPWSQHQGVWMPLAR